MRPSSPQPLITNFARPVSLVPENLMFQSARDFLPGFVALLLLPLERHGLFETKTPSECKP